MKVCKVEGCDKPTKSRGLCPMHLNRFYRHGDPLAVVQRHEQGRTCDVDGCDRKHCGRGLCNSHLHRLKVHGDVFAHIPIGDHAALLAATAPLPDVEACVDCGDKPYCEGAWRCGPCMRADLARRTARRPFGQSSATPDPSRTAVRQARMPTFARRGAA